MGRKFTFHVGHSALLYLVSEHELTSKLAQWTLLLQEFEFNILHQPGVQHREYLNEEFEALAKSHTMAIEQLLEEFNDDQMLLRLEAKAYEQD